MAVSSVHKSITVEASQERAFEVFTEGIASWWPEASHHVSASERALPVIDWREGGRWCDVGDDGVECPVGHVIAFEPPDRLVLGWQLNAEFEYDPDFVTEVEVRFIAEGEGRTRVELEHRDLERYGEKRDDTARALDGERGWTQLLGYYADRLAA
jgi:uncharacterized protein YndB with AHSA1/START domain